jgi:transcriptional regulator with XRE-family HTH domain
MGDTKVRREARQRALELRRAVGGDLRRMRLDAGLSAAAVARAASIDPAYLAHVERGEQEAGLEVLAAIGSVLGADLGVRLHPNTGPLIHDRTQAPMEEALLRALHRRWIPSPEVLVVDPSRGVIDLVLDDDTDDLLVATELQGQLRRLEQQVRWHREKELSMPSSSVWSFAAAGGRRPRTSRLLVLRSSHAIRDIATTFEATLRAAYPARLADTLGALCGTSPWPGPAIAWMAVEGRRAHLMDAPPRGVRLGR